jgi:hypothetical protein
MVRTPQIDSIARDGVSFDKRAFSSVRVRAHASRISDRPLLSAHRLLGVSTGHERLGLDERTIADAFHARATPRARSASGTTEASGRTIPARAVR